MTLEGKSHSENMVHDVELKEGERRLLSSNKVHKRSPSLDYKYNPSDEKLEKAYATLFDRMIINNAKGLWNHEN